MNNNYIRFVSIVLALSFSMEFTKGQVVFTGSDVQLDAAVKQSDAVFTGQIKEIGWPVIKALGEKAYYGVQVKMVEVLKGTVDPVVSVNLIVRIHTKEMAPEINKTYIFFANKRNIGSQFQVLKLLPVDDDTITQVKALIAAAPAPK